MKQNVLQAPLIKSAIVLVIFSLLFYFTSTTPEGSVWSSIGSIFIFVFRTVQLAIGLAISLAFSLAVLIGIFFGAVALVNPASSSRMYEGLRQTLLDWFAPVVALFKSDREEKLAAALDTFGQDLKNEFASGIQASQAGLLKNQAELETRLNSLSSRMTALEQAANGMAPAEQLESLAGQVNDVVESTTGIKERVDGLKSSVEKAASLDISWLEQSIAELQSELASMRAKVEEALQTAAEAAAKAARQPTVQAPAENPAATKAAKSSKQDKAAAEHEEHRIFSYFDNDADKKKVADLVASTLKKDMSYKQVIDFVAKELGGNKGKIITSHPSLSKDYIRQCRKKA